MLALEALQGGTVARGYRQKLREPKGAGVSSACQAAWVVATSGGFLVIASPPGSVEGA